MQWSQIKTLFILCFLVLDVYLLIQFFDKKEQTDYNVLDKQESSIEDILASDNITIPELPSGDLEESYIIVSQKLFNEEERQTVFDFENQETLVLNNNLIVSKFEEPIDLPDDIDIEGINAILKDQLLYPDDYVFWEWNKKLNVLIYFQQKQDRSVFFNQSGLLLVFLNDKNELVYYSQTMLGEVETLDSKMTLIKPIKAIEVLYDSNGLFMNEEVTGVKIGFHTAVPLANGDQSFAPTWKVTVNDQRNYFINAIQGFVITSNEETFLNESISSLIKRVNSAKGNKELKDEIVNFLTNRLETSNRSEF